MTDRPNLDRLRELDKAATPGPWAYDETEIDHGHLYWVHAEPRSYTSDVAEVIATEPDAALIAAYRNATPALTAALDAVLALESNPHQPGRWIFPEDDEDAPGVWVSDIRAAITAHIETGSTS